MAKEIKECYIIGGGTSLKGFDFKKLRKKDTIVVNKSIFHVPNPTYFVTTDYSFLNKIKQQELYTKFKKIKTSKIFVIQSFLPYIKEVKGRVSDTRYKLIYDLKDFDTIIKCKQSKGMGLSFSDFRSGLNSGYCALQLAVILGYNRIYLLGIDLQAQKQTHFHGGYGEFKRRFERKLTEYYKFFMFGLKELKKKNPNIHVYSCSKISRLNKILEYYDLHK